MTAWRPRSGSSSPGRCRRARARRCGSSWPARRAARDWQPGVRARVREQAASTGGLLITARARFGFRAALGSTDDPRPRLIRQTVSPDYAGRILAARERGATEAELQELVAQALGLAYFGNFGERAKGVEVEFTDVDYIDFNF
ncbi:telomere-protecting terminal protein Tpg [Streptomyces yaanensis]|uniref:Telomere-protecting terminal protein Tpg n=1 Tax=Streptomyces yaanensis TaxID=1142239 RepID=A0ABV7SQL3_9ACTN|nr:hypothetical protein [Streptomyces sp. CGMCC 4.7035]WNB99433.1 hypothetical protein Q2K21_15860 [Streptomyces sp. CGMCC 4.7035]